MPRSSPDPERELLPASSARSVPRCVMPARGRHSLGLARIQLRRVTASKRAAPVAERRRRIERRREQMPLPPGFVDRRRAA